MATTLLSMERLQVKFYGGIAQGEIKNGDHQSAK
jgi:hypothetical protein